MSSSNLSDIPLPSNEFCDAAPGEEFQIACKECIKLLEPGNSYVAEHTHTDFGVNKATPYTDPEEAARVCVLDIKKNMVDAMENETPSD